MSVAFGRVIWVKSKAMLKILSKRKELKSKVKEKIEKSALMAQCLR